MNDCQVHDALAVANLNILSLEQEAYDDFDVFLLKWVSNNLPQIGSLYNFGVGINSLKELHPEFFFCIICYNPLKNHPLLNCKMLITSCGLS